MISKRCLAHLRQLVRDNAGSSKLYNGGVGMIFDRSGIHQHQAATTASTYRPNSFRSMATVSDPPSTAELRAAGLSGLSNSGWANTAHSSPDDKVPTTVYKFPEMEPLQFAYYPKSHLYLPMRRDILHRAVVYEGDKARQGTSFAKTRWDVYGSHKKVRPQKGLGKARLGDRMSPAIVGGGTSHGPKPRDFSTGLQRKVYDLAWRIALSYRYRRGQLVVVDAINDVESCESWYLQQILQKNGWGRADGRSTLITQSRTEENSGLFRGMLHLGKHGRIREIDDIDVKNLLELGKLVVEKAALDRILARHSSDLKSRVPSASSELPPIDIKAADL